MGLADHSFDISSTLTAGPTEFVATHSGNEEHQMTLVGPSDVTLAAIARWQTRPSDTT